MWRSELSKLPAAVALWCGLLVLGGALCLKYPGTLTTPEVRALYPVAALRVVLWLATGLGIAAAAVTLRRRWSRPALLGTAALVAGMVLGGGGTALGPAEPAQGLVALDWLIADGLLAAALVIPLEKLRPRLEAASRRAGWKLDTLHFALNHLLVHAISVASVALTCVVALAAGVRLGFAWVSQAPLVVQVVLALLVADFIEYWLHRALHEVPWLWRVHAVHHSSEHMDALAGSRVHLIETFVTRGLVALGLTSLGISFPALLVFGGLITLQATVIHANVRLPYAWLEAVLVSPRFHHWHHASDGEAIDTNYAGTFAFFDALFGTLHLPPDRWPLRFGVVNERVPKHFFGQLAFPFTAPREQPTRKVPSSYETAAL